MFTMLSSVVHGMDGRPVALGGTVGIPNGAAIRRTAHLTLAPSDGGVHREVAAFLAIWLRLSGVNASLRA